MDLSDSHFFHPSVLLPLIKLVKQYPNVEYKPPSDKDVAHYVELMGKEGEIGDGEATYCPIVSIPRGGKNIEVVMPRLYRILDNGRKCGGETAFKSIVGELVDNIEQHSEYENAYVMGQSYNSRAYTEICFFDDGKSIPGVFASHDFHYPSDCEAIIAAINGTSTKKDEGRGMGLGSSVNLLTNGLNGQVLIVSRKGLVYLDGSDKECLMKTLYELEESLSHQGTMIAVRIPFPSGKIDPYPYLGGKIRILV